MCCPWQSHRYWASCACFPKGITGIRNLVSFSCLYSQTEHLMLWSAGAWGTQITIACFLAVRKTANQQDQESVGLKVIDLCVDMVWIVGIFIWKWNIHKFWAVTVKLVFGEVRLPRTPKIKGDLLGGRPAFLLRFLSKKQNPHTTCKISSHSVQNVKLLTVFFNKTISVTFAIYFRFFNQYVAIHAQRNQHGVYGK